MIRATFLFVFLVSTVSSSLRAQSPIVVVDENHRATLHGNVHPSARPQYDVGRTDPSLRMRHMTLLLVPSKPPQRNWRRLPAAGTVFGVSEKQLQTVTRWLRSHGLLIERTRGGNFSTNFSGTVAQVEDAFRVEIHDYLIDGQTYYANANRASIPSALSGLVAGVNSLDDFPASGNAYSETVLHDFTGTLNAPAAGGIMDSAGNLYGTTTGGGSAGLGTVFKLSANGNETVLHNFTGANGDGANPNAGLVMDSAGNLYGTTSFGGAGYGTVFKLDATGSETVLYGFVGPFNGPDGATPAAGLIMDSAGNLYGTTCYGGAFGTIFKLDPTGHETVLYSFTGTNGDGAGPSSVLIRDSAGNLYGTTANGGASDAGTVFKLDTAGHETVLYSFVATAGGSQAPGDGLFPQDDLIMDSAGSIYGTTVYGGANDVGTVFELDTAGHYTVLYSFVATAGGPADGEFPEAGLIMDSAGNLYGTTSSGGADFAGTVFKLDTTGHETVLCSFTGANGAQPNTALITDSAGNLYGSTLSGGSDNGGTFFKLDIAGQETVLFSFPATNGDGAYSEAGLILDSAGNLYGTTVDGGASDAGTVFKLDPTGTETVLHNFTGTNGDGAGPSSVLITDSEGTLYGTTVQGGASGAGTVFKVDTTDSETVLYSFGGLEKADGDSPQGGLIMDNAGNFYGTTFSGGMVGCQNDTGCGTVFKINPTGQETVLYSFNPANGDGENPAAGLVLDSAGNLYGTTSGGGLVGCQFDTSCGTVFKIDPTGHETVLYSFTGSNGDGAGPSSTLIMDSAGNLYGTTDAGGLEGIGTVFELDTTGHETVLYSFEGTPGDAYSPHSGLIMDKSGNLYGTTYISGTDLPGTVYKLDTTGNETVLYSFTGGSDGGNPHAGLIMDNAGNLYGTTGYGGPADLGVVFELSPPPSFAVVGASVSISPGATSGNSSTITVTPNGGFTGNVTLTAAITSSPAGAQSLPTLSFGSSSSISITGGGAGTATLTISTTAANSALTHPVSPEGSEYAAFASSTGLLGVAMFFGMSIPARRRRVQMKIGAVVFLAAFAGSLLACGGGSSSDGGNAGTTPGTYTVTVTGTSGNLTETGTVFVTVQ